MTALLNWWKSHPSLQKALADFWTPFVAGVMALSIVLPDSGDWRNWAIVTGVAILNVALNAARRSWDANAIPVIKELSGSQTNEVEQLVNLLNNLENVDPSYVALIRTWAHAQIGKLLK